MKSVNILTLQMSQWRLFKDVPNVSLIDATYMGKNQLYKDLFAPPDFDMVRMSKSGELSEEAYLKRYLPHIYKTSKEREKDWLDVLDQGTIVMMCFCKTLPAFCHRHSLKDYLVEFAMKHGYKVGVSAEVTKDNINEVLNTITGKESKND